MKRIWLLLLFPILLAAQEKSESTNTNFDIAESRILNPGSILIQGEVNDPGSVDVSRLPIRNAAIKEVALENGKYVFKGAFYVSGYSLYDILNLKKAKKSPENKFAPPVDMYVVVENAKGEKAAYSWGEIFYREGFNILITKTVQPIYPAHAKASWTIFDRPRLVCGNDLLNVRFIDNPTKITVKSFHGAVPTEKPKDGYSPEISIVSKTGATTARDFAAVEKRNNRLVLYGHGAGFKEVADFTGFVLKDVLKAQIQSFPKLQTGIVIVSATDGYRSAFSLSEIMNRNDNQEYLLNELKDNPVGGRYTLRVNDFFADRDVRSVSKIELVDEE
jgi:hypothetical protein